MFLNTPHPLNLNSPISSRILSQSYRHLPVQSRSSTA